MACIDVPRAHRFGAALPLLLCDSAHPAAARHAIEAAVRIANILIDAASLARPGAVNVDAHSRRCGRANQSVSMKQLEAVTELTYNIDTELNAITFHFDELPFT
jgi:hypothetical protein